MRVSIEDAVGVLNKWVSESNPISVGLIGGGLMVNFAGFMMAPLPNVFNLTHTSEDTEKVAELIIDMNSIDEFEYSEVREAPKAIHEELKKRFVAALVMRSNNVQCTLYELEV